MADCLFIVNRKFYSSFALRFHQVQHKKCGMKLSPIKFKKSPATPIIDEKNANLKPRNNSTGRRDTFACDEACIFRHQECNDAADFVGVTSSSHGNLTQRGFFCCL